VTVPLRRRLLVAVAVALPVVWSMLTTPSINGKEVPVEFRWDANSGFELIRTADGLGRTLDPPYDQFFSNPIVTVQARRLIANYFRDAGCTKAEGRVGVIVVGSVLTLGFQSTHEMWRIKAECPTHRSSND